MRKMETGMGYWSGRVSPVVSRRKTIVDIAPEDGVRFQGVLYHPEAGQWFDRTTLEA